MTPLLCPVWCAASLPSASRTTSFADVDSLSARAVPSPTMPPPMMAMSWVMHSDKKPTGERIGVSRPMLSLSVGSRRSARLHVICQQPPRHVPRIMPLLDEPPRLFTPSRQFRAPGRQPFAKHSCQRLRLRPDDRQLARHADGEELEHVFANVTDHRP